MDVEVFDDVVEDESVEEGEVYGGAVDVFPNVYRAFCEADKAGAADGGELVLEASGELTLRGIEEGVDAVIAGRFFVLGCRD